MKRKITYSALLALLVIFIFSCVPARKVEDIKKREEQCRDERDQLRLRNKDLETTNTEMTDKLAELEKQVRHLENDTARQGLALQRMTIQYDKINELYELLLSKQKELVAGNESETRKILVELQKAQEDLQKQEDVLKELERTLDKKRNDLDALRDEIDKKNAIIDAKNKDLEARNRELIALQNKLKSMDSIVNALKDKVSSALVGFEGDGLTVEMKNGKVYVSMENKLLFKSGSFTIDQKGKDAIKKLAGVLAKNEDVSIMVEGHTDTDAYNGSGQLKDNWDLSARRATEVVKTLLDGATIAPMRITAAGRGEFLPIDPGTNAEAKAKNRRTDIILTPKLDELFQIIGSN